MFFAHSIRLFAVLETPNTKTTANIAKTQRMTQRTAWDECVGVERTSEFMKDIETVLSGQRKQGPIVRDGTGAITYGSLSSARVAVGVSSRMLVLPGVSITASCTGVLPQ
jgi:hypothetical protein